MLSFFKMTTLSSTRVTFFSPTNTLKTPKNLNCLNPKSSASQFSFENQSLQHSRQPNKANLIKKKPKATKDTFDTTNSRLKPYKNPPKKHSTTTETNQKNHPTKKTTHANHHHLQVFFFCFFPDLFSKAQRACHPSGGTHSPRCRSNKGRLGRTSWPRGAPS